MGSRPCAIDLFQFVADRGSPESFSFHARILDSPQGRPCSTMSANLNAAADRSPSAPVFRDMFSGVGPTSQPEPASSGRYKIADESWREYLCEIQKGNAEALAKLYDATSRPLYSLALRIVGNAADAEEVLLDVYQQVWRAANSFNPARGGLWNWLVLLTRSRALDRLRNTCEQTTARSSSIAGAVFGRQLHSRSRAGQHARSRTDDGQASDSYASAGTTRGSGVGLFSRPDAQRDRS